MTKSEDIAETIIKYTFWDQNLEHVHNSEFHMRLCY